MARAFTSVSEITAVAGQVEQLGPDGIAAARRGLARTADEVRTMQRKLVHKVSWETHDSITIRDLSEDEVTVGPTNRDAKGRPVGFFIEYGRKNARPFPFVRPSGKHAAKALPGHVGDEIARLTGGG